MSKTRFGNAHCQ